jgi:hypothetical protein
MSKKNKTTGVRKRKKGGACTPTTFLNARYTCCLVGKTKNNLKQQQDKKIGCYRGKIVHV